MWMKEPVKGSDEHHSKQAIKRFYKWGFIFFLYRKMGSRIWCVCVCVADVVWSVVVIVIVHTSASSHTIRWRCWRLRLLTICYLHYIRLYRHLPSLIHHANERELEAKMSVRWQHIIRSYVPKCTKWILGFRVYAIQYKARLNCDCLSVMNIIFDK